MKATELNIKKVGYNFNAKTYPAGSHYKVVMRLGRAFPSTKEQAKFYISEGICISVLNADDVEVVETLLNKYGFEGEYKPTKSGRWVSLMNNDDFIEALKSEYNL